jgi:hypothetical protein
LPCQRIRAASIETLGDFGEHGNNILEQGLMSACLGGSPRKHLTLERAMHRRQWGLRGMNRYIVEQEPTCTWAVFDTIDDIPATVDGVVAIGLSLSEATLIAARANNPRAALTLVYGDSEIGLTRPAKPRSPTLP